MTTTYTECAMKQEFLNSWNFVRAPCVILPNKILSMRAPTHIYVSHAIQILKNSPECTMRYSVQSGRNTENETHAHLLRNA